MTLDLHQAGTYYSVLKDKLVLVRADFHANLDYNVKENASQLSIQAREEAGNEAADGLLDVVSDHNLTLGMIHKDRYRQEILLWWSPEFVGTFKRANLLVSNGLDVFNLQRRKMI